MKWYRVRILFPICVIVALNVNAADAETCSGTAGVAIARAYALAVSYPDSVPEFVENNAQLFVQNGEAIECGRMLVSQLLAGALSGPSPSSVRDQALDVASRAGHPELGPSLGDDMLKHRCDMYQLARYVQSLVDTLPSITAGDVVPYQNSDVYQASAFIWNMMLIGGLDPDYIRTVQGMTGEMSEWYVGNFVSVLP